MAAIQIAAALMIVVFGFGSDFVLGERTPARPAGVSVAMTILVVLHVGMGCGFAGLAIWARRQPMHASVVAALLFAASSVFGFFAHPPRDAAGLVILAINILLLVSANYSAWQHDLLRRAVIEGRAR